MSLQPLLIAPFQTGLDTDLSPWIAPPDSFSVATNVHVRHGIVEKRSGLQLFGSLSQSLRVMGIGQYVKSNGIKSTLAWDTTRAYIYNTGTLVFDLLDSAAIMSSSETDYIWFVNWQATGGTNRLYFTNGKAFNGTTLDGIRFYDDSVSTTATTSFTPILSPGGATVRTLYGCKLLFSIKQRLLCLHTFENEAGSGTSTFPQRMRWCKAQNPGNWVDTTAGGGGFVDAPTGEQIISARQIQDQVIVYFTDSVWAIVTTSNPALPFRWVKINSFRACDGKMASVGYDRYAGALGVRGITASDTNQTTRIDDRIQDFVVDSINIGQFGKVYCARDYQNKRWWTLFPSNLSEENDAALIYDDDSKAYTKYDISLNCLGYGTQARDWGLNDFTGDYDYSLDDMAEETLIDYFWQDNQEMFLGGDTSGNIYVLEAQGDDDGAAISSELVSAAWNPFQQEGDECQMSYVDFYVDSQLGTTALIEFFKDSSIYPYSSQQINFLPNSISFVSYIIDITQANPANVNAPSHGLSTGDEVYIYNVRGMEEINALSYIITVVDGDNFTLDGINSSAFSAYLSGGVVLKQPFVREKIWKRAYAGGIGNEHSIRITSSGIDTPFRFHAFKPYFKKRGRRTIN